MGYWIELHCDSAPDDRPRHWQDEDCRNTEHDYPSLLVAARNALLYNLPELAREAKRRGWTFSRKDGWRCKQCNDFSARRGDLK